MLGTGLGVVMTGVVLGGIGGLFGRDWERRQIDKYLGQQGSWTDAPTRRTNEGGDSG